MNPLRPLSPPQLPIAGSQPPVREYALWFASIDATVRAMLASPPNVQAASYVLALSDGFGIVETNVAGANNLTVPLNGAIPFPIGTRITVAQIGAGTTTLVAAAGVTIRSRLGLVSAGQYAVFYLYKRATDEWVASGDLT